MVKRICQLYLFFSFLSLITCQFYSERTKCSNSYLTFDSELTFFFQNTQYQGISLSEILSTMSLLKPIYHFGMQVTQTKNISNHRCSNYYIQKDICCHYQDLDAFTNKLFDLYRRTYYTSPHPIVNYIYKIYNETIKTNWTCLNGYTFNLPALNQTILANSTSQLAQIISNIAVLIKPIKDHQKDFIINSACMFCLGINDFKTFIHPIHSDLKKTKRLIYNQQYFINVTNMVAKNILNARTYADQIHTFINNTLKPKVSNTSSCSILYGLINNQSQIQKRKICNSLQECLRFGQKFIGQPGAPSYSKVFASFQTSRSITYTNYKVITSQSAGFKGNVTYKRYMEQNPPVIWIKGNNFTLV